RLCTNSAKRVSASVVRFAGTKSLARPTELIGLLPRAAPALADSLWLALGYGISPFQGVADAGWREFVFVLRSAAPHRRLAVAGCCEMANFRRPKVGATRYACTRRGYFGCGAAFAAATAGSSIVVLWK